MDSILIFFSCITCFLKMRKNMKRAGYYLLLHVTLLLYLIDLTHSFGECKENVKSFRVSH